jgi:epoxyqueuosine reductase
MNAAPTAPGGESLARFIHDFVEDHLAVFENNNLGPGSNARAWDGFLLGYSTGADELYPFLKSHIGDFHWTPAEAFALGRMEQEGLDEIQTGAAPAGELTVVSCVLAQTEAAKAGNRAETRWPSEPWARARICGHKCLRNLQKALVAALDAEGYEAVAPSLLAHWAQCKSERFGDASTWSERHVAHISGLGTFGLSGGLITELGKAHRLASVIVRAQVRPTPRPYSGPFDYCLHYATGSCAKCADRCPAGSIDPAGRDKPACSAHLDTTGPYVKQSFGFDGYGCGLCQTGTPCESRIPERTT